MSILSRNNLSLPTAIGLGTAVAGAAGNVLGQLLGTGMRGGNTAQNEAVTNINYFAGMRDNLFSTSIFVPSFLIDTRPGSLGAENRTSTIQQDLMLYAESVNLPGVNISTGQTRRYGFGPNVGYARDVTFNDVAVTFIADGAGVIHKLFTNWMNGIVKFDDIITGDSAMANGEAPFFFRYKKEYVAKSFYITVENEKRDQVSVFSLIDAFPIDVSDITLNWGSTNQLARFTVTFRYTNWKHFTAAQELSAKLKTPPSAGDASILSMLFQAGTAATLLTSLRRPQNVGDVVNVASTAAFIFGRFLPSR